MPACIDPTFCKEDPPHVSNAVYSKPEQGTLKYKGNFQYFLYYFDYKCWLTYFCLYYDCLCILDGENIFYVCENPEFVFPEPPEELGGRPKKKWEAITSVECGWDNKWQRMPPSSHKVVCF